MKPLFAPQQSSVCLALNHTLVGIGHFGHAVHVVVEIISQLLRLAHKLVERDGIGFWVSFTIVQPEPYGNRRALGDYELVHRSNFGPFVTWVHAVGRAVDDRVVNAILGKRGAFDAVKAPKIRLIFTKKKTAR